MRRSGRLAQRLHAMSSRLCDACYCFQPVRQRFRRPQSHHKRKLAGQARTSNSACDLRRSEPVTRGIDLVASLANWYQTTGFSNQSAGLKAFTA